MRASRFFVHFVTDVIIIKIFWNMIFSYYIIHVFLMFASTFKRTHWLVPGYCLGQIPCVEISIAVTTSEPTCWHVQPRKDRSYPGQLFLWEMESHRRRCTINRFRHQPLETKCCTPRPQWSCTTYFVLCLEFLYQVGASSANSNPGAGEHKGHFLGNLYPENPVLALSRADKKAGTCHWAFIAFPSSCSRSPSFPS